MSRRIRGAGVGSTPTARNRLRWNTRTPGMCLPWSPAGGRSSPGLRGSVPNTLGWRRSGCPTGSPPIWPPRSLPITGARPPTPAGTKCCSGTLPRCWTATTHLKGDCTRDVRNLVPTGAAVRGLPKPGTDAVVRQLLPHRRQLGAAGLSAGAVGDPERRRTRRPRCEAAVGIADRGRILGAGSNGRRGRLADDPRPAPGDRCSDRPRSTATSRRFTTIPRRDRPSSPRPAPAGPPRQPPLSPTRTPKVTPAWQPIPLSWAHPTTAAARHRSHRRPEMN